MIKTYIKNLRNSFYRATNNKPCPPFLGIETFKMLDWKIPDYFLQENVKYIHISENEFRKFEKRFNFEKFYDRHWVRFQRKVCEYFVVDRILDFSNRQAEPFTYIDAMSSSSEWASNISREYSINAYSADINEPSNAGDCFIRADVTSLPFEDASIDAISVQSGMELLSGNDDIKFLNEVQRVLRPKGKFVILPLYLNPEFCNLYGRSYYQQELQKDEGAVPYVRLDYDLQFTRLYDLNNLEKRLLSKAESKSCWKIFIIDADDSISLIDKRDSFIYLRYALVYEKEQ